MKYLLPVLFSLMVVVAGCEADRSAGVEPVAAPAEKPVAIPETVNDLSALTFDEASSRWLLDETPYSGYAVTSHDDGSPASKIGFFAGQKHGPALRWHPDGQLRQQANYQHGLLHGEKKNWLSGPDHVLVDHLHYERGKAHGEQTKWYPTGELYKVLNLTMGREEGLQRAYRKNGALYANYEAKNGRIFGLKKSALCYGLEDETINDGE